MGIVIVKQTPEYRHAFVDGRRVAELLKNDNEWVVNPCVPWIDMRALPEDKIRDYIESCVSNARAVTAALAHETIRSVLVPDDKEWQCIVDSAFHIDDTAETTPPKETKLQKKIRKQITRWMKRKKK